MRTIRLEIDIKTTSKVHHEIFTKILSTYLLLIQSTSRDMGNNNMNAYITVSPQILDTNQEIK